MHCWTDAGDIGLCPSFSSLRSSAPQQPAHVLITIVDESFLIITAILIVFAPLSVSSKWAAVVCLPRSTTTAQSDGVSRWRSCDSAKVDARGGPSSSR